MTLDEFLPGSSFVDSQPEPNLASGPESISRFKSLSGRCLVQLTDDRTLKTRS